METPAGRSFFFSLGDGLSLGDGEGDGVGDSSGVSVGDGLGENFFFFDDFGEGDGDGERFGFGFGVGVVSSSSAFGERFGDGLRFGVGDEVAFALALRCFFFGEGVGVGSKKFLSFVPNDWSSARDKGAHTNNALASASAPPN